MKTITTLTYTFPYGIDADAALLLHPPQFQAMQPEPLASWCHCRLPLLLRLYALNATKYIPEKMLKTRSIDATIHATVDFHSGTFLNMCRVVQNKLWLQSGTFVCAVVLGGAIRLFLFFTLGEGLSKVL